MFISRQSRVPPLGVPANLNDSIFDKLLCGLIFNRIADGKVIDFSGKGNNWTLTGNSTNFPKLVSGRTSSVLNFNATTEDRLSNPGLVISNTASYAFWFYPTGTILDGPFISNIGENIAIYYSSQQLNYFVSTNHYSNNTFILNQWNHGAITVDNARSEVKMYLNGILDPNIYTSPISGLTASWIGSDGDLDDFNGRIESLYIWDDRVLSYGDVLDLYNNPYRAFIQPRRSVLVLGLGIQNVNQTLNFVNTSSRVNDTYNRYINQSLTFNNNISVQLIRTKLINQIINFNNNIIRNIIINQHVNQQLVFPKSSIKDLTYIQKQIEVPNILFIVTKKTQCYILLETTKQAILLPCPLWNDSEQPQNELQLKRSMVGDIITYVKTTDLRKLSYTFEIGTQKTDELNSFLSNHNSEIIRLTNWKGELWFVNLISNPFDFITKSRYYNNGEKNEIKLEFEGIRMI